LFIKPVIEPIHSFRLLYSASLNHLLFPIQHADTVLEFHAEAPQATAIEGLVQGPYVAAKAGFEPVYICL